MENYKRLELALHKKEKKEIQNNEKMECINQENAN